MNKACKLTTSDNPYNPFKEFHKWYEYDVAQGYFTLERVAAIACVSDALNEEENEAELQRAYDIVIKDGVMSKYQSGVYYKKVYED